jgi:hypothetical protein
MNHRDGETTEGKILMITDLSVVSPSQWFICSVAAKILHRQMFLEVPLSHYWSRSKIKIRKRYSYSNSSISCCNY